MDTRAGKARQIATGPAAGILSLVTVFCGLALGHSLVVLQERLTGGVSGLDTVVSMAIGSLGIALMWAGLRHREVQATLLGYLGGNLIWVGFFEWTWRSFGEWLNLQPIMDRGIPIINSGLLMIQATTLIVIVMLIYLGANKDTRCRMFMWFHRNLGLRPGRMTAGYERQYSRITAMETVFLIWFIYLCAITINDPRLIRYDSTAAMLITAGFIVWGLYLVGKLLKIRTLGAAFRYAIPTGNILWLPTEALSRWGLYPEIWIKPLQYTGLMALVLVVFVATGVAVFREPTGSATAEA
jgi:hypothetical protein